MTQQRPDNYDETSPQSAELFHLLVENIKDYAIFMTDIEGRVISWNPGVERLLGYTESEIVGQSVAIIFTPEDVAVNAPVKEMELAAQTGCAEDKRWHQRKDGSRFWANGMLMPLKNADDTLRGYAKVMRDDTEQKLLEVSLRESEENLKHQKTLLEALTESTLDGIVVLSTVGKILHFNRLFLDIWNFPAEVIESKSDARARMGGEPNDESGGVSRPSQCGLSAARPGSARRIADERRARLRTLRRADSERRNQTRMGLDFS